MAPFAHVSTDAAGCAGGAALPAGVVEVVAFGPQANATSETHARCVRILARSLARYDCFVLPVLLYLFAGGPDLLQFTPRADAPDAGWKEHQTKHGIVLERRKTGTGFYEHRSIIDLPVDPVAAGESVWMSMREGDMDSLKHCEILRSDPDQLLIYDQIKTPLVSDRDYTITVTRTHDAAARRTTIKAETHNELGPPPVRGLVRIPIIRAGWMVEPGPKGARIHYYAYSEPGGLIAAFLARGAQADRSMADMVRMAARLLKLAPP